MNTASPVWTVGHSNRPIEDFLAILGSAEIALIVDIRRIPKSRANPQFGVDRLPGSLEENGIGYTRIPELGGFKAKAAVPQEVNGLWRNRSFHNYADYALSPEFAEGLDRLVSLKETARTAIMCSEAVWWRCHRRLVADHLLVRGCPVLHLMGSGRVEEAKLTPGARWHGEQLTYPA